MTRRARILALGLLGLGVLSGCDAAAPEAEVDPIPEITLAFEDNVSDGYVFSSGVFTTRPLGAVPQDPLPDLLVFVFRTQNDDSLAVAIGTDYSAPRFRPIGDFGGADEAEEVFSSIQEAPPFDYDYFTIAVVEEGQVWVVRTLDDRYAKILILETERRRVGNRSEGSVRLGWAYPIPAGTP